MKTGIALGCGGAKGFAHIPYLQAIDELGIKLNCISGTSMGALIGAFYAGGMPAKEIHKLVTEFGILDTPKVITLSSLLKSGLIRGERIENSLRKNLPVQRFEKLKIPMKISATDYWDKKEYVFEKGDIVPAIRASISIPGIFQPYYYNGRLFVDGGLVNPYLRPAYRSRFYYCCRCNCRTIFGREKVPRQNRYNKWFVPSDEKRDNAT